MKKCAFVVGTGSSFLRRLGPGDAKSSTHCSRNESVYRNRKRSRAKIVCSEDSREPVEDGVTLPQLPDAAALQEETEWLSEQLTEWLNVEWRQGAPQPIHRAIGDRTAQIYARQRMEGQDDLSSVLIAIGSELEGMDFSSSFVGPWNIANKTSELLLEHRAGPRVRLKPYVRDPDSPTWSREAEKKREGKNTRPMQTAEVAERTVLSPSLADRFEKMKFLRDVIDGSVSGEMVDGAVAATVGFLYDSSSGGWNGSNVEDEHFKKFGDCPPDILGDETNEEFTETLKYLEKGLGLGDDETGELAKSLDMVIETLHGTELTEVQRNDEKDHAFHKRVVVAKWLHLKGGF